MAAESSTGQPQDPAAAAVAVQAMDAARAWSARIRVVLVETSLPRNIGAAARAMRTMGLERLVLVQPAAFPHPDAAALASGADAVLADARVCAGLPEALAGCVAAYGASARRRGIEVPQLEARAAGRQLTADLSAGEVALVFGSERVGLTNEQIACCQYLVSIPTAPDFGSLNLAAAVQLLTYECRMAALESGLLTDLPRVHQRLPQSPAEPPATLDQLEGYFQHLQQTLEGIGFFGDRAPHKLMQRLRRLYQRAAPSAREVQILRGILAETQRSMRR